MFLTAVRPLVSVQTFSAKGCAGEGGMMRIGARKGQEEREKELFLALKQNSSCSGTFIFHNELLTILLVYSIELMILQVQTDFELQTTDQIL